jgi:hypothetical protein
MRQVLRHPDKRVVHWGKAEHRKTVLGHSAPMMKGDLVLLFQGNTESSIRGFYGIAEIVNLKDRCQAGFGRRGKHSSRFGIDIRYLAKFSKHMSAREFGVVKIKHKNLKALIEGAMGEGVDYGTVFGMMDKDWSEISSFFPKLAVELQG